MIEKEDEAAEVQEESDSKRKQKADDIVNAEKIRKKAMERMNLQKENVMKVRDR